MPLSELFEKFMKDTNHQTKVSVCIYATPLGKIFGVADDKYLYAVMFEDSKKIEKCFQTLSEKLSCVFVEHKNKTLVQLEDDLLAYFRGSLKKFSVPIKTFGSDFQQMVWSQLQQVPFGTTLSYGDLGKAMGKSTSHARAIGSACGANQHLIIVPCHRVVASNSKGGFSCGIDRKHWLIEHEKKYYT